MNLQLLKSHWVFSIKHIIIAGGFFRDNFLGIPITDIDIYININNIDDVRRQLNHRIATEIITDNTKKFSALSKEEKEKLTLNYMQMQTDNSLGILEVKKYRTWQGELLDLILVPENINNAKVISSFDYTINALAYDTDSTEFIYHNQCLADLWSMKLTELNSPAPDPIRRQHMINKGFK